MIQQRYVNGSNTRFAGALTAILCLIVSILLIFLPSSCTFVNGLLLFVSICFFVIGLIIFALGSFWMRKKDS